MIDFNEYKKYFDDYAARYDHTDGRVLQDPPREALVRLTAKGIDLMEGTLDDEGVAFGDPMRQ